MMLIAYWEEGFLAGRRMILKDQKWKVALELNALLPRSAC